VLCLGNDKDRDIVTTGALIKSHSRANEMIVSFLLTLSDI